MANITRRSSASVWLIGKPNKDISSSRLPSKGDVLSKLMYHHMEEKLSINDSLKLSVKSVIEFWNKAHIPTQRAGNAERKLKKLFEEYVRLKKGRTIQKESCRMKEDMFKGDLTELFDIAAANAMAAMTSKEDKKFLIMQREDLSSASFGSEDKNLTGKEEKKRKRAKDENRRKDKEEKEKQLRYKVASTSADYSPSSSSLSTSEDEYRPTVPMFTTAPTKPKKTKKLLSQEVAMSLDRVNLSDRKATYVIAATAQALGHDLHNIPLSRSTIRRSRRTNREAVATEDMCNFSMNTPFLLHWDGKLVPDIVKGQEKVDRIAIVISSGGVEKLLGVPAIPHGTGQAQADVCIKTLDEWGLKNQLRGLVFDTTASNTGLKGGACAIIERSVNRPLLWVACRHHMYEIVLAEVFKETLGASSGPDISLFKRFKTNWMSLDQSKFAAASNELFTGVLRDLREKMIDFHSNVLEEGEFLRDDYAELQHLSLVFLGGVPNKHINFRAPGALHNARWMAKAIYSLKIYLFRDQIQLTSCEQKGLLSICQFVALIYAKYWHKAPLAAEAPRNDRAFLIALTEFPDRSIRDVALKAFKRHLWYFAEELVGLALFDKDLDVEIKSGMQRNLLLPAKAKQLKRLDAKFFVTARNLDSYVTEKTANIFDVLMDNGKQMAATSFLLKEPDHWSEDVTYKLFQEKAAKMKVVNDCAERGVALIQQYNSSLTKDESQKQYLLRLVDLHRKAYPKPSKGILFQK